MRHLWTTNTWRPNRVVLILLILVGLGFYASLQEGDNEVKNQPPIKLDVVPTGGNEYKIQEVLTDWVYSHSTRISRGDCSLIVATTRSTDKALFLLALMEVESNYVPSATSSKGAIGLTQVMPNTWEKHLIQKGIIKDRRDLYDIQPSIIAGNEIITICLKNAKGDSYKALEAYLGGQDGSYVKRILTNAVNLYLLVEPLR